LARIFAAEDERSDRVRAEGACSLGRLRAAEAVGGLAEAIYDRHGGVREAAQRAFPAAVSALVPEHYGMMESRTTPHLCRVLFHRDLETARAALQALWMVGDGRAVEPVARFAASGRNSRLADSASALIPVLKERSRRVMAPATLLRPADPATVQDQTLLRPATVLLKAAPYVQETLAAADTADAESVPEERTASRGS
jgi:HEAT repeat protein